MNFTDDFFGKAYEINENATGQLIQILSGGSLEASFPYSFHLNPMNCYMLLYTEIGYGKLHWENNIYSLENGTLLFLKCNRQFKVEIAVSPWIYKVFFITGDILDFYYSLVPENSFPLFMLPEYSPIIRSIQKLALNSTRSELRNKLLDFRILTDILCELILENTETGDTETRIPSYLLEMKALFDVAYQETYTLDELEEHFLISKYRLCREFHSYFGESPLQYLNARRIDIAKDLLLTTEYRIHEVGSLVGIDNTNHFIYLFKKGTGLTPLVFKKRMLGIS